MLQKLKLLALVWLFLFSSKTTESVLSPVVLIPGDGGNQLEARLHKPPDGTGCPTQSDWYRLWLDVWQLSGNRLRCWADNIKLEYNATSRTSSNVPGVETRVPGFGSTSSVEYLDPSWSAWVLADAGNYMKDLVDFLVGLGYTRDKSVVAAPFDFRFAPHSQAEYFTNLKQLIEVTSLKNNQRPVTIISHSMGGLFGLHFLQNQDPEWRDRFVSRFIPIATPWAGAVIQLNTYASGYNLGIDLVDPLVIREEQRSYETGVYILPHPAYWPSREETLVVTPYRNYTVRDYPAFFHDIGFPQGLDMLENVVNITQVDHHPGVKTTCIFGTGVHTTRGLVYSDGFPDSQPLRLMGDGDGTVTVQSAALCSNFRNSLEGEEEVEAVPLRGLDHGKLLKDKQVFNIIKTRLLL